MRHETTIRANLNESRQAPTSGARHDKTSRKRRIDPAYVALFISIIVIFAWQIKRFG